MNVYKQNLIGDLSAAGAAAFRNEFCEVNGNLDIISAEFDEDIEGVVAATQSNSWRCESPIQYDLPASNAYVLYRQIVTDTVCSEKITNLSIDTMVQGDILICVAPTVLSSSMHNYTVTPLLLTATAPQYLLKGAASSSQIYGTTPLPTAIGKAYFSRMNAGVVMAKVKAAKYMTLAVAADVTKGK